MLGQFQLALDELNQSVGQACQPLKQDRGIRVCGPQLFVQLRLELLYD